jgi:23S rRNA (guanosine2251-2'-O)-methyltransferase
MSPKSVKKHHSAKNTPRKRPTENRKDDNGGQRHNHLRRDANAKTGGKAAPRPPQNGYFVWGRHGVAAALANPDRRIAALYACDDATDWLEARRSALDADRRAEIPSAQPIERQRLDTIGGPSEKIVHQGVVAAVWPLESPHLDDFLASLGTGRVRLALLDQLSDPRNVGAIMRSARAFNIVGIITTWRNAAEENGVLARAASGALDHVPLIRVVNLARAIETLQAHDITIAGLAGEGTYPVAALAGHDRLGIMLGAEGSGLRRLSRDHCDMLVRIEIDRDADSLNVSNAAAIAFYAASLREAG